MRKKAMVSLLFCLTLLLSLAAQASASAGYVQDAAGLLTAEEQTQLEESCAAAAQNYGCGIYIVTVQDYTDYGSSVENAAEAIYAGLDLGVGEGRNGILLLLSMAERDYDLAAYGEQAHYSFTDYGKERLAGSFLDDFREDDWYGGFADFVYEAARYLEGAEEGTPVDLPGAVQTERSFGQKLPVIILVPCGLSLIVCLILRAQMKTAKRQTQAREYLAGDGVNMRIRRDLYTHSTQTVQVIPKNNNSNSGGGTTVNSGGFSHSSGKF